MLVLCAKYLNVKTSNGAEERTLLTVLLTLYLKTESVIFCFIWNGFKLITS